MAFYDVLTQWRGADIDARLDTVTEADVRSVLQQYTHSADDLLVLLSPAAANVLEEMATVANRLTMQHFGKTIQLFTPIYLSNYCTNQCVYCGFNTRNAIKRSQLTPEELLVEGKAIADTGLKHVLLLTGEAPKKASVEYIRQCALTLRPLFPSIAIEVYAMQTHEYERLAESGIDGLTLFQETYNEALYGELHPAGPKSNFRYRLDAPERGCIAGMRTVNIGALLGLDDWRHDSLMTGLHAMYLQHKYPETDIAVSLPRMRPHAGEFQPSCIVDDKQLVQIMLAYRIVMPRCGITISSREPATLRDNLIPLGVTRMSAGVSTAVGGHTQDEGQVGQFDISDPRGVDDMCRVIAEKGYQPVFKDWQPLEDNAAQSETALSSESVYQAGAESCSTDSRTRA